MGWSSLGYFRFFSRGPDAEPTSTGTLPSFRTYAAYAGEHEKEALRSLGFSVELDGTDIGPGNGIAKAVHVPEALQVLWFADHEGQLPSPCPAPRNYIEL